MSIFGLIELLTVVIYMEMRYLSIFGFTTAAVGTGETSLFRNGCWLECDKVVQSMQQATLYR